MQAYGKYTVLSGPNTYPVQLPQGPSLESIIDLNTKQKAGIRNVINSKEKIFYAGVLPKINQQGTVQDRIIVITNRFIYNIDEKGGFFTSLSLCSSSAFTIKRKINLNRVDAITLSTNPSCEKQQFIIHVRGEHDYLFNGRVARERVIKSLFNAHFANTFEPIGLFLRDEANLSKFQTSEDDVKSKKTKRPNHGLILVTPELASRGIEWIIFNRIFLANLARPFNGTHIPSPISTQNPQYQGNYPGNIPNQGGYPSGNQAPYGNGYGNSTQQHQPNYAQPQPTYNKPQYYVPEPQNNQGNFHAPNQGPSYPQQQNETKYNPEDFNSSAYPQQNKPVNNNNNNAHQVHQPINKAPSFEQNIPQLYAAPNNHVQINTFAPQNDQYKAPNNGGYAPYNGGYNGQGIRYGPQ